MAGKTAIWIAGFTRSAKSCRDMRIPLPKSPLCLAALAFFAAQASSFATVTLIFSTGGTIATNWANSAGQGGTTLAWGVIVDRDGNGLAANYSTAGIDYSAITSPAGRTPQTLTDGNDQLTDDILFMSPIGMTLVNASPTDGALTGQNRINAIASVQMLPGFNAGDRFYLVWFDQVVAPASSPTGSPLAGQKFGIFGDVSFVLQGDGSTVSYAPAFTGAEPMKQMNYTFVPEPATAVLSLLGALGLLRRRRA